MSPSPTYHACTLLAPVVNGNILAHLLGIADGHLTGRAAHAFRGVSQLLLAVGNAGTAAVDTLKGTIALQRREKERANNVLVDLNCVGVDAACLSAKGAEQSRAVQ